MDGYDEALFDDLGFDEAEGAADGFDELDEMDEGDEFDEIDQGDEFDEADEGDEMDEGDEFDETDEFEAFEEGEEGEEGWDEALAFALAAEDSDEFLRRLRRGITRGVQIARRVASTAGRVARVVGPIASMIPLPQAQAIARVANVVGRLRADEASEDESLDAFAELAVRVPAAVPIAAAVAARRVLGPAAARLSTAQRTQAIRTVRQAATNLINRGGPTAIRALPRIVRSVQRTSVVRRTPPSVRPNVLARTAARVANTGGGGLNRRLTRPLAAGRSALQRTRMGRAGMGAAGAALGRGRGRRRRVIRGPIRRIVVYR